MLQRIFSISMAFLILLSTTGLIVDWHYCNNKLKDWALFSVAESCHKAKAEKPHCPYHAALLAAENEDAEKNCCNNETDFFQIDVDLVDAPLADSEANVLEYPKVDVLYFQDIMWIAALQDIDYLNYKPPLIVADFCIQHNVFLC